MTNNRRAVGYVRCSTDQQEDSPEQQKREIQAFAVKHNFEIGDWYVDFGKSGTTFDQRPEFQKLLRAVESKPTFRAVICYDESRWGRAIDAEENTYWRVYFRRHGVDVVLVKTAVDPKHEYAPMLKAFEGVQASQYSKKLSELTLRGTMSNGEFSNGGTAPYGYRRKAINQKTGVSRILDNGEWCTSGQEKVVWDIGVEGEVSVVREIFGMRLKGYSFTAIAGDLNNKDIPCAQRGRWRNHDQKWSAVTIKAMLENPAYRGARVYNRNSMSKILADARGAEMKHGVMYPHWQNGKEMWSVFENAHPAIVSEEMWFAVNPEKTGARKDQKPRYLVPYLLSGLIRCGQCGHHFQGQSTRAKNKSYFRYVCAGYNSKGVCSYTAIKRDYIEDALIAEVRATISDPAYQRRIQRRVKEMFALRPSMDQEEFRAVEKRIEENVRSVERLTRAIEQGTPVESIVKRIRELEDLRDELETRKQEILGKQVRLAEVGDLTKTVREYVASWGTDFDGMSVESKRWMIRKIVTGVTVDKKARVVRFGLRTIPAVADAVGEAYETLEKTKTAPGDQMPFRRTLVAGTGTSLHLQLWNRSWRLNSEACGTAAEIVS